MKRSSVTTTLFSMELYSRYELMYDVLFFEYTPISLNRNPITCGRAITTKRSTVN